MTRFLNFLDLVGPQAKIQKKEGFFGQEKKVVEVFKSLDLHSNLLLLLCGGGGGAGDLISANQHLNK